MDQAQSAARDAATLSEDEADRLAAQFRPAWESTADDMPPSDTILESVRGMGLAMQAMRSGANDADAAEDPHTEKPVAPRAAGATAIPVVATIATVASGAMGTGQRRALAAAEADSAFPGVGAFPEAGFPVAAEFNGAPSQALRYGGDRGASASAAARASMGKRVLIGVFAFCGLIGVGAVVRALLPSSTAAETTPKVVTLPATPAETAAKVEGPRATAAGDSVPSPDEVPAAAALSSSAAGGAGGAATAQQAPLPSATALVAPAAIASTVGLPPTQAAPAIPVAHNPAAHPAVTTSVHPATIAAAHPIATHPVAPHTAAAVRPAALVVNQPAVTAKPAKPAPKGAIDRNAPF